MLLGLVSYFILALLVPAAAMDAESAESLIEDLRRGGYIVYLRHTATDREGRDIERSDLSDCSKQRNLSAIGRMQAGEIARGIRQLGIPIGRVYSSPYCRCTETAQLAFGDYSIESDLQFSISKDRDEAARLGNRLREMMLQAPAGPANTVFVGHTANLRDGLGVWPRPEGVMVIFERDGDELKLRGMIHPDLWRHEIVSTIE